MLSARKVLYVGVVLLAALLVAVLADRLLSTQQAATGKVRGEFATRATLAGNLTGAALQENLVPSQTYAKEALSGDSAAVLTALRADSAARAVSTVRNLVLGPDGRVVAAYPPLAVEDVVPELGIGRAKAGKVGYSNLLPAPENRLFMMAIPFAAPGGQRTWTWTATAEEVATFTRGYLSSANQVSGGGAFIVDGNGRVVASSRPDKLGEAVADNALAAALRRPATTGTVNTTYYAVRPVAGTPWRVVLTAPAQAVVALVETGRTETWQLFGLFVLALIGLLLLAGMSLSRSARLARLRLHDALTGLPDRVLFLQRTWQALARQAGAEVAVLFVGLDRFKAVNDQFGYDLGDGLLAAVAARLQEAARSTDVIGRWGGDEFLVLSRGPVAEADATAERIQAALALPFYLGGEELCIAASIGVVTNGQLDEDDRDDAEVLVHAADLAFRQARRGSSVATDEPAVAEDRVSSAG